MDQPEGDFEDNLHENGIETNGLDQPNVEKNDMNMMELPDESEINDNPFIQSKTVSVGEFSFIDYRQKYVKVAPPPVYFTNDQIIQ